MKLYVGNLARAVQEDQVRKLFEQYGNVTFLRLLRDKFTGEFRGFGFVEYSTREEAQEAISALDGQMFEGRTLRVSEARERAPRAGGQGGGNGGQGGFGGPRRRPNGGNGGFRDGGFRGNRD